tara:strand:+ start:403 stop:558 length:156 start_codon:yes stop_codon:yes gene_type:complete
MIPLLAAVLSCTEAKELMDSMRTYKVSEETRAEFIQVVKDGTKECNWDGND